MRINKYVENEKLTQKVVRDIYIFTYIYIIIYSYIDIYIYEILVITYIVERV